MRCYCVTGVRANARSPQMKQRNRLQPRTPAATPDSRCDRHAASTRTGPRSSGPTSASRFRASNPPARGDYDFDADSQNSEGGIYHLHGHVVIELFDATFKADDARVRRKHEDLHGARQRLLPQLRAQRSDLLRPRRVQHRHRAGTFYHVKGYTKTKVVARPAC